MNMKLQLHKVKQKMCAHELVSWNKINPFFGSSVMLKLLCIDSDSGRNSMICFRDTYNDNTTIQQVNKRAVMCVCVHIITPRAHAQQG